MATGWAEPPRPVNPRSPVADHTSERRERLTELFPDDRLVIPAGGLKVRSNDTDYRYRPHSAFAHLTGLDADREPDAVLVIEPDREATLFFKPRAGVNTEEFYGDPRYGEYWVGARPTLEELERETGLRCQDISTLSDALAKDLGPGGVQMRVIAEADPAVTAMVEELRRSAFGDPDPEIPNPDDRLLEATSELRLIKDDFEIECMRKAIAATIRGFEDVVRSLPRAMKHDRGERVVEGAFEARAREEGNGLGYETIAAAGPHACTLHWIRNDGAVRDGDLLLLDAGVEDDSLYTADVTRTLPVNGTYTDTQREVYNVVLEAADAAFDAAVPGNKFSDVHAAAMRVIARYLHEWGLLPEGVSVEETLDPEGQYHRRWMSHGTSHHLGIDVHDCAQARREMYLDAVIEPGMIFTIEPGLYFHAEDMTVPEHLRGIGVRIEDDVLITKDGNENLSAALPRKADDIEAWMKGLNS